MEKDLFETREEFITRRINHHRKHEPQNVNQAYMALRSLAEDLHKTLNEEQSAILREIENAYHSSDGESGRFFYMSGFNDALAFLLERRNEL